MQLWKTTGLGLIAAALLAGCGGSSSDDGDNNGNGNGDGEETYESAVIDATGQSDYAYFSLATGKAVESTDSWDLAFRRTEIIMNGGDSGSKGVKMALAHTPSGFYDGSGNAIEAAFKAALPENYLQPLLDATADDNLTAYTSDVFSPAIPGMTTDDADGWYYYCGTNPEVCDAGQIAAHKIVPNEDAVFLVRSGATQADGNYTFGRFHVGAIDYASSAGERNVTLSLAVGETDGTEVVFVDAGDITLAANPDSEACYHFETGATDCAGDWDIKHKRVGTSSSLRINVGPSGSGAGRATQLNKDDSTQLASGTSIESYPTYAFPEPFWSQDKMSSEYGKYDTTNGWGWYQSGKLYPNYRVYLVDDGEGKKYAVQYSGYYHPETEASANVTLRFREVE